MGMKGFYIKKFWCKLLKYFDMYGLFWCVFFEMMFQLKFGFFNDVF